MQQTGPEERVLPAYLDQLTVDGVCINCHENKTRLRDWLQTNEQSTVYGTISWI